MNQYELFDAPTIDNSEWKIEPITWRYAYSLVKRWHYLGHTRFLGSQCFGLFANDACVGAVVYGPLSVPNTALSAFGLPRGNYPLLCEMHRLVLDPSFNGGNAGSYLVGRSLRELKKQGMRAVISYADSSRHNGAIYQACNFTYHGLSPQKVDYFIEGKKLSRGTIKGKSYISKPRSRKHRYVYLLDKKLVILWPKESFPKSTQTNLTDPKTIEG